MELERTGEREIATVPGTLQGICPIHLQRYRFAAMLAGIYGGEGPTYDIACGCGYGSKFFVPPYLGVDLDEETIRYAKKHYGSAGIDFMVGDAQALPHLPQGAVLVSFETIEHIEEPEKFLVWARKHAGLFICSSPIATSGPQSPFHVREYSLSEFEAMLRRHWTEVHLFVQDGLEIRYPVKPEDKGNVLGVCL